jgi:hypothetical protein
MTKLVKHVEEALAYYYDSEGFGYNSKNQKEEIKHLEDKKRQIFLDKEKE